MVKRYKKNKRKQPNEIEVVPYDDGLFVRHPRFFWTNRMLTSHEWMTVQCGWHVCGICGNGGESGVLVKVLRKHEPLYIDLCRRCFGNVTSGSADGPRARIYYNAVETKRRKF